MLEVLGSPESRKVPDTSEDRSIRDNALHDLVRRYGRRAPALPPSWARGFGATVRAANQATNCDEYLGWLTRRYAMADDAANA